VYISVIKGFYKPYLVRAPRRLGVRFGWAAS
jgi:hypothetical protein